MFNGIPDMVYAGKNSPVPFERGYKALVPGENHIRIFWIDFAWSVQAIKLAWCDMKLGHFENVFRTADFYLKNAESKKFLAAIRMLYCF